MISRFFFKIFGFLLTTSLAVSTDMHLAAQVSIHPPASDRELNQWQFFPGTIDETLCSPGLPAPPTWTQSVDLPHRIHLPDQPLWYYSRLSLTSDQVLQLNADDGAQVFWKGRQIPRRSPGETYALTPGTMDTLVIRVLNNAGNGGLRKAVLRDPLQVEKEERQLSEANEAEISQISRQLLASVSGLPDGMVWQAGPVCLPFGPTGWRIWIQAHWHGPDIPVLLLQKEGDSTQQAIHGAYQSGLWWFTLPENHAGQSLLYSFRIGNGWIGPYSLRIPGQQMDSVTLTVFGDSQNGLDTFRSLLALPEMNHTDLILGLGDLVANGADSMQWIRFFKELEPYSSGKPSLLIPGNHDTDGWYDDLDCSYIHQYLANGQGDRQFFRRIGPIAILGLDPNASFPIGIREEAYSWMTHQIDQPEWTEAPWKILAIHQPPYAQGWAGYEGDYFCRQLVNTIRHTGGLDVVLSGHNHDYEHLALYPDASPLHCLILGGAGGHLEEPGENQIPAMDRVIKRHHIGILKANADQLTLRILDTSGNLLEQITLAKGSLNTGKPQK